MTDDVRAGDDSVVTSTCWSYKDPRFNSQHPHGGSQLRIAPVPEHLTCKGKARGVPSFTDSTMVYTEKSEGELRGKGRQRKQL